MNPKRFSAESRMMLNVGEPLDAWILGMLTELRCGGDVKL